MVCCGVYTCVFLWGVGVCISLAIVYRDVDQCCDGVLWGGCTGLLTSTKMGC